MSENEASVQNDRKRFLKLAFCRADLLFELSPTRNILFAAGATAPLFGQIEERLKGSAFTSLVADAERKNLDRRLAELPADGRLADSPVSLKILGGKILKATMAGYRAKEFGDHFFLAVKIEAPAEAPAETEENSIADEETFAKIAAQRIRQLGQAGEIARVSLVRLKRLKEVAESLGKAEREKLFAAISRVLRRRSLGGDTAGRIDAENFGFVHGPDVDPEQVNQEIEDAAQALLPEGKGIEAKSSTLEAEGAELSEDQVARALVHSMQQFCSGHAKLTVKSLTDSLDELMTGTIETVKYFQTVTKNKEFDLVFMPICDLRMGKVHHFEALSRFRDATKAKSTFQIITLAESLNLIADFDYAVVEKSIAMTADLAAKKHLPSVAVNLSAVSLASDTFVERLHERLARAPGAERRLMFEMTESAEIKDLPRINKILQSLRDKGFKISLDDFGAGAASFDYINAFEVDFVKFDGPVVRRACGSKRGHDLLSTMAKMCTLGGIQTVAEMVEDKTVANQVFYCGIDYGQGWYFGKPTADPFEFENNFAGV